MSDWTPVADSRLYRWEIRIRGGGPTTSLRHVRKSDGKTQGGVYVAQSEFSARNIADREAAAQKGKGR